MRFLYHSFFRSLAQPVLALPRIWKRIIVLIVDATLCLASTYFAFYLRLGYWVDAQNINFYDPFIYAGVISLALALPIFILSGLYLAIFRYSGLPALITVTKAVFIYGLAYASIISLFGFEGIPRTIGLLQPLLLLLAVGASRAFANVWLGGSYLSILRNSDLPRVLIYGAGSAGRQLAAAMANSHEVIVTGFLDDDSRLQRGLINGLKIYNPENIQKLIETLKVNTVLLALPSLTQSERNNALRKLEHAKVLVRTLPGLMDLAQGKVTIADLKELDIDDLLARDIIGPDQNLLRRNVAGQVVLITGAGGSIGSELCRQILRLQPKTLILLDHSELALYQIHEDLVNKRDTLFEISGFKGNIVPILGSVNDQQVLDDLMREYQPYIIYHAAAYKHVPMVEVNPFEGIKNNTFGTITIANVAIKYSVPHFVLVSTDKAVRPTNVMGASKRLAEMVLQAKAAANTYTIFTMVRFGNVLASSGSVIPKFRQQIKDGGPVTVTDFQMTRYFMTIPEAAQLVIQAGAMAKGGEVFLLDMGQPVRIYDLARRMIELSGLEVRDTENPEGDIEIEEIGLRPGEKLYEELLISGDPESTSHARIFKAHEELLTDAQMQEQLIKLKQIISNKDHVALSQFLRESITGYYPGSN